MADDSDLMSDLLLRGVTMLGDECPDCGNPLFRHDGDVFCAACDPDEARRILGETPTGDRSTRDAGEMEGENSTSQGDTTSRGQSPSQNQNQRREQGQTGNQNREVVVSLSKVARRLADEAEDEEDLDRLGRILDNLESTLDIIERLS
ncbi:Sjogren's syndrome/scleroderma autoantigen 1 family protein [Halorutilales archaeon Cl-col2-1]